MKKTLLLTTLLSISSFNIYAASADTVTRNYDPVYDKTIKSYPSISTNKQMPNTILVQPNQRQVEDAARNYNPEYDMPLKMKLANDIKARQELEQKMAQEAEAKKKQEAQVKSQNEEIQKATQAAGGGESQAIGQPGQNPAVPINSAPNPSAANPPKQQLPNNVQTQQTGINTIPGVTIIPAGNQNQGYGLQNRMQ